MDALKSSYSRGRGKLRHNNRKMISKNVDKDRLQDNIIIKMQGLDEAYEEIFGEARDKYNAKQKRADRKIDNYFEKLFECEYYDTIVKNSNKQQSYYEWVIGLGDKDTAGYKSHPDIAKKIEECLQIYMLGSEDLGIASYQERNPNFHVFNAVIHCDESTPHLHLDAVPFADGYKTGMTRQQGIAKALEQMGYGIGRNAIERFTKNERAVLRQIYEANGLSVAEEEKGRGKSYTPREYGKMKDEVKANIRAEQGDDIRAEIEAEITQCREQATEVKQELENMQNKALEYEQTPKKRFTESKEAYEERVEVGKQAVAVKQRSESLDRREQNIEQGEQAFREEVNAFQKYTKERKAKFSKAEGVIVAAQKKVRAEQQELAQQREMFIKEKDRWKKEKATEVAREVDRLISKRFPNTIDFDSESQMNAYNITIQQQAEQGKGHYYGNHR